MVMAKLVLSTAQQTRVLAGAMLTTIIINVASPIVKALQNEQQHFTEALKEYRQNVDDKKATEPLGSPHIPMFVALLETICTMDVGAINKNPLPMLWK